MTYLLHLLRVRECLLRRRFELILEDFVGTSVSRDCSVNQTESFFSVADLVFNRACFIYIGAWLDSGVFDSPALDITPWRLVRETGGRWYLRDVGRRVK